jgi:hypothetical protein
MKSQYYHNAVTGSQNTFNESPGKSVFVPEKSIAKLHWFAEDYLE